MEAFISWVGAALGALVVIAVLVAGWEHLFRTASPPPPAAPAAPRVLKVDVSLDKLAELPAVDAATQAASDAAQRRATLDVAMSRMARPAAPDPGAWIETSPMVLHPAEEPPGPAAPQPAAGSAAG